MTFLRHAYPAYGVPGIEDDFTWPVAYWRYAFVSPRIYLQISISGRDSG
jgi:hypothetical protein